MYNPQDVYGRLRGTLQFTDEDLVTNRGGQLTQAQYAKYSKGLSSMNCAALVMLPVFLVIIVAIAAVFFLGPTGKAFLNPSPRDSGLIYVVIGALIFVAVLVCFSVLRTVGFSRSPKALTLQMAEGIARLAPIRSRYGSIAGYYLHLGGAKFPMFSDRADGFQDQVAYRVYYLAFPGGGQILSAEPIDPTPFVR